MPDLFELSGLELDEISLCPEGDNQMAKVALSKAATKTGTGQGGGKHHKDGWQGTPHKYKDSGDGKCELCNHAGDASQHKVKKSLKQTLVEMFKAGKSNEEIAAELESLEDDDGVDANNGNHSDTVDKNNKPPKGGNVPVSKNEEDVIAELPEEAKALFEKMKTERDEAIAKAEEAEEDDEDFDEEADEDDEEEDDVKKVLAKADPRVKALIEKMEADTKSALTIAKQERDARLEEQMLSKANQYKHISGTPAEKAAILKSAYEVSKEHGQAVENTWKAANAQLDDPKFLATIGKSTTGDLTVGTKVESKATELRKEDPKLTQEQAIAKVYAENPDLYDEEMKENQ